MSVEPGDQQTGHRLSIADRKELGRSLRKSAPRSSHAEWVPAPDRADPVAMLAAQDADRLDFLVPIRHLRMGESAFTFYRGTAAIMAGDLAGGPVSGLNTQICGDAHLSNFGAFASPERALLFDVNDFDETLVGPWEWDVKRLAASLVLAARSIGLDAAAAAQVSAAAVDRYREAIREFSKMGTLELWYDRVTFADIRARLPESGEMARFEKVVKKARRRTSLRAFSKLAEFVDGKPRLRSDPPLLVPFRELPDEITGGDLEPRVRAIFDQYRETLNAEMQVLLSRFEMVDVALKVVGVGSVGTRCFVALLIGRDEKDPLLLQVKEAGPSALEAELGSGAYANAGQRVVEGQRLMQAFGDNFLGWAHGAVGGRDFYLRQLKDMKGSADIEAMDGARLGYYAGTCGWTLARAHARAGDPVAIAAYLGKRGPFTAAVCRFAEIYADQAESDYSAFAEAVASGALSSRPAAESPIQG
jgi:hypothetical protein